MMMMMSNLFRNGRRHLHTIISRDLIKPYSPTPSHLKTYNLSLFDRLAVNVYMPVVAFYPASTTTIYQTSDELKNSLSHTLNQYYPFAGRLAEGGATHVDCNDEGVEFIETSNDGSLSEFLRRSEHEDLDQLFPNDLIWYNPNLKGRNQLHKTVTPLSIQVNHFSCGGVAVAASLSHKIGDASSLFNFITDWAKVTRSRSGDNYDLSNINPDFIRYQTRNVDLPNIPDRPQGDCVTKRFVFPNSKINDLKAKITAMTTESGEPIMNPTRAEALTWLLHKSVVAAALKTNPDHNFMSTGLGQIMSLRSNLVEPLPEKSIGNLYMCMELPTRDERELTPNYIIGEIRKRKKGFRGIGNVEAALGMVAEMCSDDGAILEMSKRLEDYYIYTVIYRFPAYGIDFGWGKPIKVSVGGCVKNLTIMMDTPNGDGVELLVCLEKEDMKILQNDSELLAFCPQGGTARAPTRFRLKSVK